MKEKIVIQSYVQEEKECYKLEHYKPTTDGILRYAKGVGDPKDDWIGFKLKVRLYLENNRSDYEYMYKDLAEEKVFELVQLVLKAK